MSVVLRAGLWLAETLVETVLLSIVLLFASTFRLGETYVPKLESVEFLVGLLKTLALTMVYTAGGFVIGTGFIFTTGVCDLLFRRRNSGCTH